MSPILLPSLSVSGCPFSRDLPGRGVEAVPDVDQRDLENQGRTRGLVIMPGDFIPDVVRHRVRPIAEPGDGLSERECGAFGVGKVGSVSPGRHGEEARVRLACLPELARVHVNADAAAIDLARPQMDEFARYVWHILVFRG